MNRSECIIKSHALLANIDVNLIASLKQKVINFYTGNLQR